jgi:hypothetical protein
MTDRELMQMALDALANFDLDVRLKVIPALRARLAQPEPEGKYSDIVSDGGLDPRRKFDVAPQRQQRTYTLRKWQGLTDEEILEEYRQAYGDDGDLTDVYFARAIEAALKAKNA